MADNTLNFDLDAPAVPTLTLDPTTAAVPQEEKPAAAPAPEAQVNLTPEEQADTQKLLDMGIKIYSQQTPTFKVVPIDHI